VLSTDFGEISDSSEEISDSEKAVLLEFIWLGMSTSCLFAMTIVLGARLATISFLQARRADTTSAGVEGPGCVRRNMGLSSP